MGEVYRTLDTRLDRTVAIKVVKSGSADRVDLRQRFDREARVISQLSHPHICALYDGGQHDGFDFFVMEYVDGETLAARLSRRRLPLEEGLKAMTEIADAIACAHRYGIVHRDLTPRNIMLTRSGAKLLDFGLATRGAFRPVLPPTGDSACPPTRVDLTVDGTVAGTLRYLAPEQLEGKDADRRSDIFAFGAVLYEVVTRRKAFDGTSQARIIAQILGEDSPLSPLSRENCPPRWIGSSGPASRRTPTNAGRMQPTSCGSCAGPPRTSSSSRRAVAWKNGRAFGGGPAAPSWPRPSLCCF